ncbi:MAG: zinc ribbon domain-containing protein [bacterium]
MNDNTSRFQKLEHGTITGVFKKAIQKLKRFERLEVNGHKIKIENEEISNLIFCPKCQRNNPKDRLYCLYCGHVFEKIAEKTTADDLKPYQIRCPGCSRICVYTQTNCIYCGFNFRPEQEEKRRGREKEPSSENKVITVNIDGKVYRSTDEIIPSDVKQLMGRIKNEGYSQELIDRWIREKKEARLEKRRSLEKRVFELKQQIVWRTIIAIGFILFLIISIILRLGNY